MSEASSRVQAVPGGAGARATRLVPIKTLAMAPVLDDLSIRAERVRTIGDPPRARGDATHALVGVPPEQHDARSIAPEITTFAESEASADGTWLVFLAGARSDAEIASFRNALWPLVHVGALYRLGNREVVRATLEKTESLRRGSGLHGVVLVGHRREIVLAPDATVKKFDRNAAGWNGEPGRPGYGHFRWMRRHVALFAEAPSARRILDFGCGAGWVGIEAALAAPSAERATRSAERATSGAELCAFDPSPEMVKLAEENARASGIARFTGRTGFGEDPPFPAPGEEPFDLVLSSGVVSFAADRERWLDGLVRAVAPRGVLVIGDINRDSIGMQRRRRERPLLPLREMSACTREEIASALERRGLALERSSGYQLTRPIPQLMHWSETRLGGVLSRPLLWTNRAGAALIGKSKPERFDSWVMRLRRA